MRPGGSGRFLGLPAVSMEVRAGAEMGCDQWPEASFALTTEQFRGGACKATCPRT